MIDACAVQRTQHGPRTIDIVHPPAAVPAPLSHLHAAKIADPPRNGLALRFADLRQHGNATRSHVFSWRIQQSAMISERNIIEIMVFIVAIERAPGTARALHANNPLARSRN